MASAAVMTPMSFVRSMKMRLLVSSCSYSGSFCSCTSQNASTFLSQPGGTSTGWPPMRMEL